MTYSDLTAHSLPLFSNLKLLKVDDLYKLSISSFVYECHNNLAPTHFTDYFTQISAIHSYNTRGASHGDYIIVRKNTPVYGIRSICFKLMVQRSGITSLLTLEIHHLFGTSIKG